MLLNKRNKLAYYSNTPSDSYYKIDRHSFHLSMEVHIKFHSLFQTCEREHLDEVQCTSII